MRKVKFMIKKIKKIFLVFGVLLFILTFTSCSNNDTDSFFHVDYFYEKNDNYLSNNKVNILDISQTIVQEYFNMPELPRNNLTDPEVLKEYKRIYEATRNSSSTCSKYVKNNLQKNKKEQSNGETAFEFFVESIQDDSLILLDEPENSLSAKWQMELVKYVTGAVRAFRCQFVIATHSPFLLSIPGAKIYNLDAMPICTEQWYNLENIRCYYDLFKENERFFSRS